MKIRACRSDAMAATLCRWVERVAGLPRGCVRLVWSSGRTVEPTATVGEIRFDYADHARFERLLERGDRACGDRAGLY